MRKPPLKPLHSDDRFIQLKLDKFRALTTDVLLDSLMPGREGALKVKRDGTVMEGNHRLKILRERDIDVDNLPREDVEEDSSA
jgi:hypothetical protein